MGAPGGEERGSGRPATAQAAATHRHQGKPADGIQHSLSSRANFPVFSLEARRRNKRLHEY